MLLWDPWPFGQRSKDKMRQQIMTWAEQNAVEAQIDSARELIAYLMDRIQIEERQLLAEGYDIPPLADITAFDTWSKPGPPVGTLFNYMPRPWHHGTLHIAASPAPQEIAVLVYNRAVMPSMARKISTGASNKEVIAWAKDQLEEFAK
jgi:hypothetical protein